MKTVDTLTKETAQEMIAANDDIKELFEALAADFEIDGPDFEYTSDYLECTVAERYNEETGEETLTFVVAVFNPDWDKKNLEDAHMISYSLESLEQVACVIHTLEYVLAD